jgi:hypothetical protein
VQATVEELDRLVSCFVHWLKNKDRPMNIRLIGAARITTTLAGADFKKIRGERFGDLLDLLFQALPRECDGTTAGQANREPAGQTSDDYAAQPRVHLWRCPP